MRVYNRLAMDDGLISQQQASEILGVTRQRVNQMIKEGLLTPVSLAGFRLLMVVQVMELKAKREAASSRCRDPV